MARTEQTGRTTNVRRRRATGRAFGISGTPMAVLLDGNARIASTVAAGAQAIWDLLAT
jgi:hypothetical protein